jgi:hypothetical protein
MPYPHTIRLRGPWQVEPLARGIVANGRLIERDDNLPAAGRGTVPSDWGDLLGKDFRGRVRYRRSFNPPGALDSHERLWLVVEGVDARGCLSLNGVPLGEVHGYALWASFDVTSVVSRRNELVLDVELPAASGNSEAPLRPGRETMPGGPIGEVRLEVRSQWFIEPLAIWSLADQGQKQFALRGQVEGEGEAPLAIVINGCQRELAYLELRSGECFESVFSASDFPSWTPEQPTVAPMEIKLLAGGGAVWQSARQTGMRTAALGEHLTAVEPILPDSAYADFDSRGTQVIQHVPPTWAERVCARLAHHPCIAAWSAGSGQLSANLPDFGRQWL